MTSPTEAAVGARCENCGASLAGPYCSECGQAARSPLVSLRAFLSHALDEVASLDGRLVRSARALLFRPGELTAEYLAGRRVRHTPPFQLYLLAAALFFLVASYRPFIRVDTESGEILSALPGMMLQNDVTPERMESLAAEGASLALFAERFQDATRGLLPAFLVGSVLVFSLVLHWQNRKREPRYIGQVVFALHWATFYLVAMAGARLLPPTWQVADLSLLVAMVWLTLALRRVYGYGRWAGFRKAFGLVLAFLAILALWVQAAVLLGMRMA